MGKKSPGVKNRKGPRAVEEMSVKKEEAIVFIPRKEKRIRKQKIIENKESRHIA